MRFEPAALVALLVAAPLRADVQTYIVLPDGSGSFPTIQDAINASSDGDEILLGDGSFFGDGLDGVNYLGKAITIRSLSGNPGSCVLEHLGSCGNVYFVSGEGPASVLEGVTVWGAGGWHEYPCSITDTQGAIACVGSSPTIRNVVLLRGGGGIEIRGASSPRLENVRVVDSDGPALRVEGGAPVLVGCVIESNTSVSSNSGHTGGLYLDSANVVLENCRIENNLGYSFGALFAHAGTTTLRGCVIVNNGGDVCGGLGGDGTIILERCTISRNAGACGGIRATGSARVTLDRTILWGNCGGQADEAEIATAATLTADCSDIRVAGVNALGLFLPGPDGIDNAPLFCGPEACGNHTGGWYAVDQDSQVILTPCGPIGALSSECNVGVEQTTWGKLKALYR